MCLAIPGEIVEIRGNKAVIDYKVEKRTAIIDFVDVEIGQYVYVQAGIVIEVVEKEKAEKFLEVWLGRLDKLKDVDERLSKIKEIEGVDSNFKHVIEKVLEGMPISKVEALFILNTYKKENLEYLFSVANNLRSKSIGNSCCVHGLIEFSNYCKNHCSYCGINVENTKLKRYRMSEEEVIGCVVDSVERKQFKVIVLQSGEDFWYTKEKLVKIVKGILEKCNVLLFLSIGVRDVETYKELYDVGARGVLFRFEEYNKDLYDQMHGGDYELRIETLKMLKDLGYLIATGFLVGLPKQKPENVVKDILYTGSFNPEMYSFGPFIPHPCTKFRGEKKIILDDMLKVIALTRLIDPKSRILVTTALETLDKKYGRRKGLMSGANSLMINLTPDKYKKYYEIYPRKYGVEKSVPVLIKEASDLLYSLGRLPTDLGRGV